MARPERIKTELGQRLRDVRKILGDTSRDIFSATLNVNAKTLANYERGDSLPDAAALKAYLDVYSIDLNWLLTGTGEAFTTPEKVPGSVKLIDIPVLKAIAATAHDAFINPETASDKTKITEIAAEIYNELLQDRVDFHDEEELATAVKLKTIKRRKKQLGSNAS